MLRVVHFHGLHEKKNKHNFDKENTGYNI
jgi:hypothetical protein